MPGNGETIGCSVKHTECHIGDSAERRICSDRHVRHALKLSELWLEIRAVAQHAWKQNELRLQMSPRYCWRFGTAERAATRGLLITWQKRRLCTRELIDNGRLGQMDTCVPSGFTLVSGPPIVDLLSSTISGTGALICLP